MNYCPHCNTNYVYSAATHVCTTNTSAQLAGLRAEVTKLREELEEARKVIEGYRDALHDRKGRPLKCTIWRDGGSVYETDLGESARAFLARKEAK